MNQAHEFRNLQRGLTRKPTVAASAGVSSWGSLRRSRRHTVFGRSTRTCCYERLGRCLCSWSSSGCKPGRPSRRTGKELVVVPRSQVENRSIYVDLMEFRDVAVDEWQASTQLDHGFDSAVRVAVGVPIDREVLEGVLVVGDAHGDYFVGSVTVVQVRWLLD